MTRGERDLASRCLDFAGRAMAARRGEWARAMRGELDVISTPRDRLRFALGCVRVALTERIVVRLVVTAVLIGLIISVAVLLAFRIADVPLRIVSLAFTVVLACVPYAGRRRGPLGPVGPAPVKRAVRLGGYVAVTAFGLTWIAAFHTRSGHTGPAAIAAGTIEALIALSYLVVLLRVTTDSTPVASSSLAIGAGTGAAAALVCCAYVAMHSFLPDDHLAPVTLITVLAAGCAAYVVASARALAKAQLRYAAAVACVIASLLVFTVPLATYALIPATVPDPSPGSFAPQLSPADHQQQDAVEAADPYVGVFLVGGALSLMLGAATRPRERVLPPRTQHLLF